ncbi:hypothetical protein F442_00230 [Phytophthora nicotianae P10297]|uniref:Uncharacterized protein n=1 Tax=Phytophthora nicotianae P10297 TaxID=1317064 RepID=W3A6G7_PHYNI|nr:hypothetical protein F442_00230 [Phytophthora nicotianae P10297]
MAFQSVCRLKFLSMHRNDITPAEREVILKCRKKGARRGGLGALMGALAMAGVWKSAAFGTAFVGGLVGAWMSIRASRLRLKMTKKLFKLPDEKSHWQLKREKCSLQLKLPHNAYVKKTGEDVGTREKDQSAPETSKDK